MPKKDLADGFELPALPAERTRTPVSEESVAQFVDNKAPRPRKLKASKASLSSSRLRRDNIDGERLNIYVPTALAQDVRERAFRERRSVSDAVTEALEAWLRKARA